MKCSCLVALTFIVHDLPRFLGRYLLIQNTGDIYPYPDGSFSPATGSGTHTNQIHHRITVSYTIYLNRRLGIKCKIIYVIG
ncbi:hypothetical protein I7I53_10565 [Histoplasma capsulatum var. duboisii H88]|uniref:Uncharacterized protein n=1 Tax=Ajellomyces capsulatus (strain H88) TaxID=544711 RepID=A0A8A1L8R4_AJEC8|nr:hypothetical protein I7I53_10565 [Histoplasma capsulatum var. duboisii H88]